ncbi:hypothetical protein GH714_023796 [Hevea brasiliensis]|uniref:Leucine-rich repeat-containing N-terminal plant-type domain-containing protein n=1 Tax=Hevea brasiliensis TaxID=3981 RepID=A0A6A6LMV5_HEVBR|nr:hypothetical protein GH714_023796 [Hevea brasiliensis]
MGTSCYNFRSNEWMQSLLGKERIGLLEFKAFLKSNCELIDNLDSWVEDGMSDCCGWDRVKCNTTSRRVVDLSLNEVISPYHKICSLNLSMFYPFEELLGLNLSGNGFYGWIHPAAFANLKFLETLDISYNDFNGNIIMGGFCGLKSLVKLGLSNNHFSGPLPQCLGNLSNLRYLDLSSNQFSGNMQSVVSKLTSIERLLLSGNNFEGLFSFSVLANHSMLELPNFNHNVVELEISNNNITGQLPKEFGLVLSNLEYINMSRNSFHGIVPFSIGEVRGLRIMDLSNNNFSGALPGSMLGNCTDLNALYLSKQLQWNDSLGILDLSENCLSGSMPSCFVSSSLRFLFLQKNSLSGSIPYVLPRNPNLMALDLRDNKFTGNIPSWINQLSQLRVLSLAGNALQGKILDKGQFETFVESSYRGNPGLCGPTIYRSCNTSQVLATPLSNDTKSEEEDEDGIDMVWFY